MPQETHSVLILPGLGENEARRGFFKRAAQPFRVHGLTPKVISAEWEKDESFTEKLDRLDDIVAAELEENDKVSLIGASASGALVVGAFMEQPELHRVVTVSSLLNTQTAKTRRHLMVWDVMNNAAADGIRWIGEHQDAALTPQMRERLMNTSAMLGDPLVPPIGSTIPGAVNVPLPPVRNHIEAVSKTLTKHGELIVSFLK